MPPKCAKFLFLTKFLGCTEITLCNTDSCLNAQFLFLLFVCFTNEVRKNSRDFFFKKNNQTSIIRIFYCFCIYLVFFFPLLSLIFVSFILPNVLRRGNNFYHF